MPFISFLYFVICINSPLKQGDEKTASLNLSLLTLERHRSETEVILTEIITIIVLYYRIDNLLLSYFHVVTHMCITLGPSGPGAPGMPLGPCRPVEPISPLSPGVPRSPCD